MTPIEAGEAILQGIEYIVTQYERNHDRIDKLEKRQVDLYHEIEFTPLDIQRGYKLAKQLQDIRKERRKAKDENEIMHHMYNFLTNGLSRQFALNMTSSLARARKREQELPLRGYYPRSTEESEVQG